MSQITQAPASRLGAYVRSIRWGLAALVASAVIAWYGAYGDPNPKPSQEQGVPVIIGVMAVITLLVFGALVAPGLRGITAKVGRWAGVGLGLAVFALLAVPFAAWSGLPLTLGLAAAVLGSAGRTAATRDGGGRALPTWATALGVAAIVLSVVMVVLGNTALSR